MRPFSRSLVVAGLAIAHAAGAPCQRLALPPVHPLGAITARCPVSFLRVVGVRQLPGGRILVSDAGTRRLMVFDSSFNTFRTVLDSSVTDYPLHRFGGSPQGPAALAGLGLVVGGLPGAEGRLAPASGDSIMFLDALSWSYLVVSPLGAITRFMAVPRGTSVGMGASNASIFGGATAQIDPRGRMVFSGTIQGSAVPPNPNQLRVFAANWTIDSVPLMRDDTLTHTLDTIAWLRVPAGGGAPTKTNPVPVNDDWTILSDGTIALIRGRDFHIDWIDPDDRRRSTAKVPFEWQLITAADKHRLTDAARANLAANPMRFFYGGDTAIHVAVQDVVADALIPDAFPAFRGYSALADADDHLWIRVVTAGESVLTPTAWTSNVAPRELPVGPGGRVYAIIDRNGSLIDRVQIPPTMTIAGFGPRGVIYLAVVGPTRPPTLGSVTQLIRARVR